MLVARHKLILAVVMLLKTDVDIGNLSNIFAFLMSDESFDGGHKHYRFVDTGKKLFSVVYERDCEYLFRNGIMERNKSGMITGVSSEARNVAFDLVLDAKLNLKNHVESVARLDESSLKKYIKNNGGLVVRSTKKAVPSSIFTVGYEGETADQFFEKTLKAGIKMIIDVRRNPVSRKAGFSKKVFRKACESMGIEYVHFPSLGIGSDLRKHLKTREDYRKLLDKYEKTILNANDEALSEVVSIIQSLPSALLCFEADHQMCHRSRLAGRLSELTQLKEYHL